MGWLRKQVQQIRREWEDCGTQRERNEAFLDVFHRKDWPYAAEDELVELSLIVDTLIEENRKVGAEPDGWAAFVRLAQFYSQAIQDRGRERTLLTAQGLTDVAGMTSAWSEDFTERCTSLVSRSEGERLLALHARGEEQLRWSQAWAQTRAEIVEETKQECAKDTSLTSRLRTSYCLLAKAQAHLVDQLHTYRDMAAFAWLDTEQEAFRMSTGKLQKMRSYRGRARAHAAVGVAVTQTSEQLRYLNLAMKDNEEAVVLALEHHPSFAYFGYNGVTRCNLYKAAIDHGSTDVHLTRAKEAHQRASQERPCSTYPMFLENSVVLLATEGNVDGAKDMLGALRKKLWNMRQPLADAYEALLDARLRGSSGREAWSQFCKKPFVDPLLPKLLMVSQKYQPAWTYTPDMSEHI